MIRAFASIEKRGFSLLEFLIAMTVIALVGIALFNGIAAMLTKKNRETVAMHAADAAEVLRGYPAKLNACLGKSDPCAELLAACNSSLSCGDTSVCDDNNTCVVCYTDPYNGRKLFYGFVSDNLTANTYKVTICWAYGSETGNFTTTLSLP